MTAGDISRTVKAFILETVLPGESPDELDATTPLVTGRILDSIQILKLVAFLEERYDCEIEAHELTADHFESLDGIAALVESKLA